ncbi:uncharacterized protein LOC141717313 isoform X2 [Apium graveolens]|uniref:uncharacterized protein LOC141717313 isoform X2 n=1 Tax=Apium graveolens TaxID=4045 RepID=UPI003D7BACE2
MPLSKKSKAAVAAISVTNKQRDVCIKSPLDHWSFLDEIEAPMWVDLNFEVTGTLHENDDEWFLMTHQFHQCSSRQLISAFSHPGEVCINSVSGRQEPCSPKLPSSVSKSRGKHYKRIVWPQSKCTIANKQHPVKSISSKLSGVDCENNITETAGSSTSTMTTGFRHRKTFSGATVSREGENNSISTITSESTTRNEKSLEVAKQVSDQPSKLLSSLRTSLRKSCGTRPAARTDINRVRRSVGTKSSSSKSSVSSSSHPGHDVNNMTSRGKLHYEKTPDSRNAMGIYQAPKNILKGPNLSKASPVQKIRCGPQQKIDVRKSINQENSKAKVESRPVRPKVLLPQRILGSDISFATKTKGKVQVSEQRKRCPGAGKENGLETMTTRKNSLARGNVSEVKVQVLKSTKERNPVKKDVGKHACVKKNASCRSGQGTSAGMVQKLYLR